MIIDSDNKVDQPKTHNCEETRSKEEKNDSERKHLRKFAFSIGNKFPKCDKSKRSVTPH